MPSMGSQFSVLNRFTELSRGSASKINRAQHFWNLTSLNSCSFEQFPQTIQQYCSIGFTSVLYNKFLQEIVRYSLAHVNRKIVGLWFSLVNL